MNILMTDDRNLRLTNPTPIYQADEDATIVRVFVPVVVDGNNMIDFDMELKYVLITGEEGRVLYFADPTRPVYRDLYLEYDFVISGEMTYYGQKLAVSLTFVKDDTIVKSGTVNIPIVTPVEREVEDPTIPIEVLDARVTALGVEVEKKVNTNQGAENGGKILQVGEDGDLRLIDYNPETDAELVSYENDKYAQYEDVDAALDALFDEVFYVDPAITSFTASPAGGIFEHGKIVAAPITFRWTKNKEMTTASLTNMIIYPEDTQVTYYQNISENKTFVLSLGDGKKTATSSVSYTFRDKVYWGSGTIHDPYTSDFVIRLQNNTFGTGKAGTYPMTVRNNEYGFIAYPKTWGELSTWKINGFDTDVVSCGTLYFVNANGYATDYYIYRTGQPSLGAISPVIS